MADNSTVKKRVRGDESSESDIPEVKRIRDDLLDILDDSEPDLKNLDVVSVMKSFEDEIGSARGGGGGGGGGGGDVTSDSGGESQRELSYLLEASDDELGLPPSVNNSSSCAGEECENNTVISELVRVDSADSDGNIGFWGFEEQAPSYDSFELKTGEGCSGDEYAAFDEGLFEYSNVCFDYSDNTWRLGATPAE